MPPIIKRSIKRAKLVYLWVTRILLAQNRFNVPLHTRIYYAIRGGFIADQYVLYDLHKNSRDDYLSEMDWYRSRWVNEPFDGMLNNKIVSNEVFGTLTRVPKIFFLKNKGRLLEAQKPQEHASIDDILSALRVEKSFFLKPIGSGKGKGVHRLDYGNDVFMLDRKKVSEEEMRSFLSTGDGWFLSETIEQHAALSALFSETTNTIRFITMRDPHNGSLRPFFAVLRIGTAETVPVDNGSRGGLVAKINLESGELSEARTLWSKETYSAHPDSGALIEGFVIPSWTDLSRHVMELAESVPYLQFIAWDLLVADDGFAVIEANTSSGVNIIQLWGAQRNGELGDFYRAHGVIR